MPKPVAATLEIFDTTSALALASARLFASHVERAVASRGIARIAISGGSTPKGMFKLLADPIQPFAETVPWDKLQLFWVDERCVPPTDAESNYRMTKENLLDHVGIPAAQIFRMEGELDPEEAASRYESVLRNTLKLEGAEAPHFDLVLLGMGDDGHTASLFPHTQAINEVGRLTVANHVPQKDTWRITLTWPVINTSAEVVFVIAGQDKAAVLAEVLNGPRDPERLPSQLIRPANGKLLFLLDEAAAANLSTSAEPFTTINGTRKVATLEI
jgi:6-phosphogluconolactonase